MKLSRFFEAVITTGTPEMRIVTQASKLSPQDMTFAQVKTALEDLDNHTLPSGGNSLASNPFAGSVNFVGPPGGSKRHKRSKKNQHNCSNCDDPSPSMEVPSQGCRSSVSVKLLKVKFLSALRLWFLLLSVPLGTRRAKSWAFITSRTRLWQR
jgi:hypothetical protein